MKKTLRIISAWVITATLLVIVLNIQTTTRQGINYKVRTIRIPLYLKILDFYDRNYNYKWLVGRITQHKETKEEKVMDVFKWTINNIVKQPPELKVVDDHVWHIIVRGYGVKDQFQDVFCTLCNYAGSDAFFHKVYADGGKKVMCLSFVKLKNGWAVFDAYSGVYFKNREGRMATIEDLRAGNWHALTVTGGDIPQDYADFFKDLTSVSYNDWMMSRSSIQTPIRRIIFGFFKRPEHL